MLCSFPEQREVFDVKFWLFDVCVQLVMRSTAFFLLLLVAF